MKFTTTSLLIISVFTALLFTTSCKKDNYNPNGSGQLSATLGGTAFQPIPNGIHAADDGNQIEVVGVQIKNGDTLALALSIADTTTIGKPTDLGPNGSNWLDYFSLDYRTDYSSSYFDGHGTMTITSWDKTNKKIAGNFSGVMYNTPTDSLKFNGQFNTIYIDTP